MPPFAAQHSLFRAYDIRGARQYFTPDFVCALGESFVQLYQSQSHPHTHNSPSKTPTVVIGYDVRYDSDAIARMLAHILNERELTVINLGLITTPMMAFWAEQYDGHGIMVTASHSAKDTLGVKWLVANTSPNGADITALYKSLSVTHIAKMTGLQKNNDNNKSLNAQTDTSQSSTSPTSRIISLPVNTVVMTYIKAIAQVFTRIYSQHDKPAADKDLPLSKLNLTIVIDCMHGATSNIAHSLFKRFCRQVIMLNDIPDGNFPAGNPDPTEPNRLAELQQTVIITQADIGLAFDGDGDRLMIVDNSGKVVTPDHLLYLLAQVAMVERPITTPNSAAPQVIFDIKCSHHLSTLLTGLGAMPVMSRTGSSLMRQQLQAANSHAIFAGELSGHFIFNDGYFIVYDDAMYAGLRLLHWLAHTPTTCDIKVQADFHNKSQADSEMIARQTDIWGEMKPATAPCQLTDITRSLPLLVSTADHYLPLPDTALTSCSIVQHLAEFCHYLQHLVDNFPTKHTASLSPTTKCQCFNNRPRTTTAQAQLLLPAGTRLSCIDGVRLDFERGFGVLRQSNTSHSLTVRFAGDSIADLREVQARFVALCRPFDDYLATQIAALHPE